MLSIFKLKPKLKELVPNNFIDIHSHFLPGIDDGAKNMSDSKFLLESVRAFGFGKCITTPHTMQNVFPNTPDKIENAYNIVKSELQEQSQNLYFASEYFIDEHFVENFRKNKLLCLKDNFILVEMSFLNAPLALHEYLFELQMAGYQPVLAHPERYVFLHNKINELERLKKMGLKFQMNMLSAIGYYGPEVTATADLLLKNNFIDFLGSDIHHKQHIDSFERKIVLKEAKKFESIFEKNSFFN